MVYLGFIYMVYAQTCLRVNDISSLWIRLICWNVGGILGEDAKLPGACDCLGPVGDVQLAIDTGCVGFDGARGYDELPGDLLVGLAQGDEVEHFQLAPGKRFNQPGWLRTGRTCLACE